MPFEIYPLKQWITEKNKLISHLLPQNYLPKKMMRTIIVRIIYFFETNKYRVKNFPLICFLRMLA